MNTKKVIYSNRLGTVFILIVNILIVNIVLAQNKSNENYVKIEWNNYLEVVTRFGNEKVPDFKNIVFDGYQPMFDLTEEYKGVENSVNILSIDSEPATSEDLKYLQFHHLTIPRTYSIESQLTFARNRKVWTMRCNPYYYEEGSLRRITGISVQYVFKPQANNSAKDFATTSVLADGSGYWCKIAITNDGIHKIDYASMVAILQGSGIDIDNLDPDAINIFGNGEGLLPEHNIISRTDDLAKNAIEIIGGSDGSFDPGDYILFYARGPHRYDEEMAVGFERVQHIYSDNSIYFVNINGSDTPLRIGNAPGSIGAVTHNITSFDYYATHENELVNLVSGGQRWYGELFDGSDLIRQFNFTVPNPDPSGMASFKISYASNVKSGATNWMRFKVNGVDVGSDAMPTAGADYRRGTYYADTLIPTSTMNLRVEFDRTSPDYIAYLDKVTLNARALLKFNSGQLLFRDLESVGVGNVGLFSIANSTSQLRVWDVTDWQNPGLVNGNLAGTVYSFEANIDSLRSYVAYDGSSYYTPQVIGSVEYQNLHGLPQAQFIIISPSIFLSQANRLADLHRAEGTSVHVVTQEMIYNEFSSGMPDATAIKFFAKMFYDRGAIDPTDRIENLLLFGDGTFDPKNRVENNNNFVLAYEVPTSEDHIGATVADDYYGLLDDNDGNAISDKLDIGVGRLLISDVEMAREQVDKVEHYMKNGSSLFQNNTNVCASGENGNSTFGDWRTRHVMIADDADDGEMVFINGDSEQNYYYLKNNRTEVNVSKIYLDAFVQETTAGGQRYPDVNSRIDQEMERGCLSMIYVGHGGEVGVAEERVITVPQIQDWDNIHGMPLLVSATCEFTKFDDPSRVSAGEWASINPNGGAIALMTSTRSIFFNTNSDITDAFYEEAFIRDANMLPRTFGDIISSTKNQVGSSNRRSFTLIGDPALRIALPRLNIVTDSINSMDPMITSDTMMALSKVTVKGHIEDQLGNVLSSYNGVLNPTVFDKPKWYQSLGNDASSQIVNFEIINSKIYKGKASVVNGYFEFTFVVPKDIVYSVGKGKISYYSSSLTTDGIGFDTTFYVGGVDPNGINDTQGPDMDLYMNSENFVSGGTTGESPSLLVKLYDENGINTTGSGIGHDLIAVLDGNTGDPLVLNDFYEADLDSYQSGEIRFGLSDLDAGPHSITVKVWDVNNNSSEGTLDFVVQEESEVKLDHLMNYPNPFTTSTEFFFEHNQVCCDLDVQIQIFTVAGRLVKTINQNQQVDGFRSQGIPWDGRDDFGDQLAKGVYIYRVKVRTPDGKIADDTEKLVLLK